MLSTMTVTSAADSGAGSLRAAIVAAQSGDTINFAPSLAGQTITLTSGELALTKSLDIEGPGADQLTVSGNNASRVFDIIGSTTDVDIHDLTIAHGAGGISPYGDGGGGGAINNTGVVTVSNSTVSGNSNTAIYNTGVLTVSNSTLSGNSGGAIRNRGAMTVSNSALSGNTNGDGGAIYNIGALTVTNSTLSGNTAYGGATYDDGGGAILNSAQGTLTITSSTLSGNTAYGYFSDYYGGGGGAIANTGVLAVTNSTLSGNAVYASESDAHGGAIYSGGTDNGGTFIFGTVTITNSTISDNAAVGDSNLFVPDYGDPWYAGTNAYGGGLYVGGGTLSIDHSTIAGNTAAGGYGYPGIGTGGGIDGVPGTLYDSVIANNSASYGPDLAASVASLGHNLIGNSAGGSGFAATDLLNVDPRLGPLQDNGGPTQTMAPLAGSPAINAGDNTNAPAYDQRGVGFPRIITGAIDIGAFEVQTAPAPQPNSFAVSGFPSSTMAGTQGSFTVTALNADGTIDTAYTGTVGFTSTDSQAALPGIYAFTRGDAGVHTFSATLRTAGTQSITATYGTATGSDSGIAVKPAVASHFAVSTPSSSTAGTKFSVTVTALDPFNNTASRYAGTLHFTSSDGQANLPGDYTFTAIDAGVHTFTSGVTLKTAGNQSMTATDTSTSLITASATIAVNAAAAGTMTVAGFPSPITAGVAGSFTVMLKDTYGNVAAGYTGTVTFSSSDPQAPLPGSYTFTTYDAGKHTFSGTLKTAGTQSITATSGSFTATDLGITVKPASASKFILSAPSSVAPGVPFSLTIKVEDAYGNIVTGYVGTVHLASSDSRATLPSNYTFTTGDNGIHTFTGLVLKQKGNDTITVSDTRNSNITGKTVVNVM